MAINCFNAALISIVYCHKVDQATLNHEEDIHSGTSGIKCLMIQANSFYALLT